MTQEAFPKRAAFKINVAANIIRLKKEGHSDYYVAQVVKEVAKSHVGKEKKFLLDEARRLTKKELAMA